MWIVILVSYYKDRMKLRSVILLAIIIDCYCKKLVPSTPFPRDTECQPLSGEEVRNPRMTPIFAHLKNQGRTRAITTSDFGIKIMIKIYSC